MWTHWMTRWIAVGMLTLAAPSAALAQTIGTFRWHLQPYCNVVTLTVTLNGGVYTLDGFDDQCGAVQRASVAGTAFLNPDGSIGIGLAIVTAPSGAPLHVDVALNLATLGGSWRDSTGATGTFVFNPASTSGTPRPPPIASFAAGLIAGKTTFFGDGSFIALGTPGVGAVPVLGAGHRAIWHGRKSAFRAGQVDGAEWDDGNIGFASVAFGYNTVASGSFSAAVGSDNVASGPYSFVAGNNNQVGGSYAVAIGQNATVAGAYSAAFGLGTLVSSPYSMAWGRESSATGAYSTAGGVEATASGIAALAYGSRVTASAPSSVALGSHVSTSTRAGSFIFGDDSGVLSTVPTANNQFVVRATGGVRFITAINLINGCEIAPTTGNFLCTGTITSSSDRHRKQDVRSLDGEEVLARVARIPVTTWSFIDEPDVRHAGPMAQDFYAAFGLGVNEVTIGYTDINGINMRAIQALEQRTRDLMEQISALRSELAALKDGRR